MHTPGMTCLYRYVCGVAKCSLAGLATGARHMELRANVMPYTTVRGAAGLEWNSRPGRYMEVCTFAPESYARIVVQTQ